jgi:hypothetical protein
MSHLNRTGPANKWLDAGGGAGGKGGRAVRDELQSTDQILKQRKIKERREQHLKDVRIKKAQRYRRVSPSRPLPVDGVSITANWFDSHCVDGLQGERRRRRRKRKGRWQREGESWRWRWRQRESRRWEREGERGA